MQTETLDLVVVNKLNSSELFRVGTGIDKLIEYVKTRAYEVPQDVSSPEGRAAMKSQAYLISKCKRPVEDAKKRETAELKRQTKAIDANGKKIVDAISAIQDEYRKPLTEWETAEAEREAAEKLAIEIELAHEEALQDNETFDKLREFERMKAVQAQKEAEEAARIAAEQAEKERLAREDQIRQDAAKKAAEEAERKVKEAEAEAKRQKEAAEQAERDRIAAEERAEREKQDAIKREQERARAEAERIERERIAKERAEEEAAERKAANIRHRKSVRENAIRAFITSGLDDETATGVIKMIEDGTIPNVTINF